MGASLICYLIFFLQLRFNCLLVQVLEVIKSYLSLPLLYLARLFRRLRQSKFWGQRPIQLLYLVLWIWWLVCKSFTHCYRWGNFTVWILCFRGGRLHQQIWWPLLKRIHDWGICNIHRRVHIINNKFSSRRFKSFPSEVTLD